MIQIKKRIPPPLVLFLPVIGPYKKIKKLKAHGCSSKIKEKLAKHDVKFMLIALSNMHNLYIYIYISYDIHWNPFTTRPNTTLFPI